MTAPTPADMPGPGRPIDVAPMPAIVNVVPIPGAVDGVAQTILRFEVITPAGSAFAHMSLDQFEATLPQWAQLAISARTGLVTPPPGLIIPPGGTNGRHPG